jgi:hypothetical protein
LDIAAHTVACFAAHTVACFAAHTVACFAAHTVACFAADTVPHFVTRTMVCFAGPRVIVFECGSDELTADSLPVDFVTLHGAAVQRHHLMEPLLVIMAHVLLDDVAKMPLIEEDEVPQALEFD